MLQELSLQRLSHKLILKEEKIFESLSGYKNLSERFSPYNPFNVSPRDARATISEDKGCVEALGSIAFPLEDDEWERGKISLEDPPKEGRAGRIEWANRVLKDFSVAATDSSTIRHNLHLNLLYAYTQVAVFLRRYGEYFEGVMDDIKVGDELYFSEGGLNAFEDEHYQAWNWELTVNLLKEKFLDRTPFILFLDESLSLAYARSYSVGRRGFLLESLKRYLRRLYELNILPVAVYFSLDRGLVNCGLKCTLCRDRMCSSCASLSEQEKLFRTFCDKHLLYSVLTENYSRTPFFRPLNPVIAESADKVNLGLLAFYVRVDESILRVEVPEDIFRRDGNIVGLVHRAVVADSLLSKGYPLTLSRAHELAVLSGRDRNVVHEIVYNKALELCRRYGYNLEVKFSRKGELKARGVL